jgi:hypothetical protein
MTSTDQPIDVLLNGRQLALSKSAAFMCQLWPAFKIDAASSLRNAVDMDALEALGSRLTTTYFRLLADAGIPPLPVDEWTSDYVAARSTVSATLPMTRAELRSLVLAIRVCYLEFNSKGGWIDFSIAGAGNVDLYGMTPDDLPRLAMQLELHLGA